MKNPHVLRPFKGHSREQEWNIGKPIWPWKRIEESFCITSWNVGVGDLVIALPLIQHPSSTFHTRHHRVF